MKFFTEDWYYKIIALILAVMLWYIVQGRDNPTTNQKFIIPVEIRNHEAGKNVDLSIKQVTVTVNDKKMVVDNLTEDNIKAYIDMTDIIAQDKDPLTRAEDHKYQAKINVEVHSKYTFKVNYNASPINATVTISDFASKSMFVDVEYESLPPAGFTYKIIDMPIKSAMITGSEENVNKVAKLSGLVSKVPQTGFVGSLSIGAFDANGIEVQDLKIEPSVLDCSILCEPQPINKEVFVVPIFKNKLPGNITIKEISVFPNTAVVSGLSYQISNLNTIKTEPIDLSLVSSNKEVESNLMLNAGVTADIKKVKVKLITQKVD